MTTTTEVILDGISFDCGWYVDEDAYGDSYVVLESVSVNGADLTGIISVDWWGVIERQLVKDLDDANEAAKLDAELDRLEAWGV